MHKIALVSLLLFAAFAPVVAAASDPPRDFSWPAGHVLPHFASPAESLDALQIDSLDADEQLTYAALAGQVNRVRPRIWFVQRHMEEGADTWLNTHGWKIGTTYDRSNRFELLSRYAGEVRGVVLYNANDNPHLRNLAFTVAGLRKSLPVTRSLQAKLQEHGIRLPVVADLTSLDLDTACEVYEHLYASYWPECEKRFLVSAKPYGRRGDYHHTRDLAAACGAATVWLDCREPEERQLLGKFLADMPAGDAVVLGWYTTERSGITTATEYGIGTLPADHFMNATVLAGADPNVLLPEPPSPPPLENKLYVTIFISDGDNIQYVQHAMRRVWDRSAEVRGRMPLNWTISPSLVDVAPGMLRYYRNTATASDCLVCGPSGMGYFMPVNTLAEPGAPLGPIVQDAQRMRAYARLTGRYLERAGLPVVTIWDNATPGQRAIYERECASLLGATVQNFKDDPSVASSVANDRLRFERLRIPYAGSPEHLRHSLERELQQYRGERPNFVAYQANIWSELSPERLIRLMEDLRHDESRIEFVRADHYFLLQAEARGHDPQGP